MVKQSLQARFIAVLEGELALAHQQLAKAREDIEFYRGKVERLELALMSNPPAQQEYVQTQVVAKPAIKEVRTPSIPPRIPFSDLKQKWNSMSAEEQEKAMQDGWDVEKTKEEANAGK